ARAVPPHSGRVVKPRAGAARCPTTSSPTSYRGPQRGRSASRSAGESVVSGRFGARVARSKNGCGQFRPLRRQPRTIPRILAVVAVTNDAVHRSRRGVAHSPLDLPATTAQLGVLAHSSSSPWIIGGEQLLVQLVRRRASASTV